MDASGQLWPIAQQQQKKKRRPYYESLTHANRHRRGDIHKILCSQQAVVAADQTLGQPIHQLTSG